MEDCKGQGYVPVYHPHLNVCSYDFHDIVLRMMRKLDSLSLVKEVVA